MFLFSLISDPPHFILHSSMAHLLNTSFLPSSSALRRKPILSPSFYAASGNRSRTQIQAKVREIFMSALSSTMTEGKIVSWVKSEDDKLAKGESVVVVESDKADMDVETFYDGYLAANMVEEGGVAAVGSPITLLAETEDEIEQARSKANSSSSSSSSSSPLPPAAELTPSSPELQSLQTADIVGPSSSEGGKRIVASPYAKKMQTSGIQLAESFPHAEYLDGLKKWVVFQMFQREMAKESLFSKQFEMNHFAIENLKDEGRSWVPTLLFGQILSVISPQVVYASETLKPNEIYEIGELFDLGIQLLYLILLLGLLGVGTYFVIRQVLVRRELDLSAKELQEQVRSGDASATELFELGAVMLRRKFYPAATKYLLQAIEKWDGDDQDLAQVYNALGVSYVRDGKLDKGIAQFETAVKLQPGYVTAWNNLGDAYEKKKEYKSALKAFEEVLLFDPNNKIARPRRDAMKESVQMYKGVPVKSKER